MNSDSGCVFVLECFPTSKVSQPIRCGVLGETGIIGIVPVKFLAVDPQRRALMIASTEKQKLKLK